MDYAGPYRQRIARALERYMQQRREGMNPADAETPAGSFETNTPDDWSLYMIPEKDVTNTQDDSMAPTFSEEDQRLLNDIFEAMRQESTKWSQPPTKLDHAKHAILQGRVTTSSEGIWHARGTKRRSDGVEPRYTITDRCTCPMGSDFGHTKFCVHMAAVEGLQRYQAAKGDQAWLLPPSPTVDERLAQSWSEFERHDAEQHADTRPETAQDAPGDVIVPREEVVYPPVLNTPNGDPGAPGMDTATGEVGQNTPVEVPTNAQETLSSQDVSEDVETSEGLLGDTLDANEASMVATVVMTDTVPVPMVVSEGAPLAAAARELAANLEAWSQQREVVTRFIRQHLVEGTDYGKIHINRDCQNRYTCKNLHHFSKDCLFKSGSEKFLGLMRLKATFHKDEETWEMLGRPAGVLCLICTLVTDSGTVVGEGRGARDIKKDGGDVNKAIKMCEKAAQLDAILRTGALSDCFTQDLEEQDATKREEETASSASTTPTDHPSQGQTLRQDIFKKLGSLGFHGGTREEYVSEVQRRTGLALEAEHYAAILGHLNAGTREVHA